MCIQTGANVNDEKRLRMEDDSYYLKTPHEMWTAMDIFPADVRNAAMANTGTIRDMCNVSLEFGQTHLPKCRTPDGMDAWEYLNVICRKGFEERYPSASREARERLEYEMDVIRHTRFANYFLVVWDIIKFVREQGILFGVRGSAAASVVLYSLGITDIDPLEYRLVFERFLNVERKEMPDIDMDFQDDRRDEVLNYVVGKYGSDRVAQIITFNTLGARGALKDVGRALGMAYGETDRVSKMVPFKAKTLQHALEVNPDMKAEYARDERTRTLVDRAMDLEGLVNHVGTHAAGVLISEEPLTRTVPLQRPAKGDENSPVLMTQFSMDPVAKLGLLKMDFLGLTSLAILDQAIKLVRESEGKEIDIHRTGFDDPETFRLLSSGNTTDVFQLESPGMQRYIRELKPTNLGDIAAMIALYRPGPMENIDRFIDSKHGRVNVTYPHESFREILDETYGVIVYQDQVLMILQQFAGYSLGSADIVRKAMGKKNAKLMAEERENFIRGATGQGYAEATAGEIFDLIEPFAGYAFNKSHSVSYAVISYWTAYFKAHHPVEYMTAVLNARLGSPDRIRSAINECFCLGIPVMLPDINRSSETFTIDASDEGKRGIRMGLATVKQVSSQSAGPIVEERRRNGEFWSADDFCRRAGAAGVKRRTLENIARAGAFDRMEERGRVTASVDRMMSVIQRESKNRDQGSMFGGQQYEAGQEASLIDGAGPATPEQTATLEKELLGVALSHNPVLELAKIPAEGVTCNVPDLGEEEGEYVNVLGIVSLITKRKTRNNDDFWIVSLELMGGILDVTVWPEALHRTKPAWEPNRTVQVMGKTRTRNDRTELVCERAKPLEPGEAAVAMTPDPAERYGRQARNRANVEGPENFPADEAPVEPAAGETFLDEPFLDGAPPGDPFPGEQSRGKTTPQEMRATGRTENSDAEEKGADGPTRTPIQEGNTVSVRMSETEDPGSDAATLRQVLGILLDHQGTDRVNLVIHTGTKRVTMAMPVISTKYSDGLVEDIEELIGPESVLLENPVPA